MHKLIESLKTLGYSDKEAVAYIALLELGRATAYSVAEKSGLKKPTAQVVLGELLKKGAVIVIPGAKKRIFVARQPEDVFAQIEEKITHAKKSLPALVSIATESRSKFKTLYFEGLKGLNEALHYKNDTARKELVGFYATGEKVDTETLKMFDSWGNYLKKIGVKMRGFTPDHPPTNEYLSKQDLSYQDLRGLPLDIYSSEVSIETQDTFVRIVDIQHLQSVIIDNPHIAKTVRQIFELVWRKY